MSVGGLLCISWFISGRSGLSVSSLVCLSASPSLTQRQRGRDVASGEGVVCMLRCWGSQRGSAEAPDPPLPAWVARLLRISARHRLTYLLLNRQQQFSLAVCVICLHATEQVIIISEARFTLRTTKKDLFLKSSCAHNVRLLRNADALWLCPLLTVQGHKGTVLEREFPHP